MEKSSATPGGKFSFKLTSSRTRVIRPVGLPLETNGTATTNIVLSAIRTDPVLNDFSLMASDSGELSQAVSSPSGAADSP